MRSPEHFAGSVWRVVSKVGSCEVVENIAFSISFGVTRDDPTAFMRAHRAINIVCWSFARNGRRSREVGEVHEGVIGDVCCGAYGEDALIGCGEVHEEPHALRIVLVRS